MLVAEVVFNFTGRQVVYMKNKVGDLELEIARTLLMPLQRPAHPCLGRGGTCSATSTTRPLAMSVRNASDAALSRPASHLHDRRQAGRDEAQVLPTDQHVAGGHQGRQGGQGMLPPQVLLAVVEVVVMEVDQGGALLGI